MTKAAKLALLGLVALLAAPGATCSADGAGGRRSGPLAVPTLPPARWASPAGAATRACPRKAPAYCAPALSPLRAGAGVVAQEAGEEAGEEAEAEAQRAASSSRARSAQPHPLSNIPPAHPNVVFSHHLAEVEDNSAFAAIAAPRSSRPPLTRAGPRTEQSSRATSPLTASSAPSTTPTPR